MEGGEGSGDDQDTERVTDEHAQPAAAAEAEAEEGGPPRASEPEPPAENRAGGRRVRQRTSDINRIGGIRHQLGAARLTRQPELRLSSQQPAASSQRASYQGWICAAAAAAKHQSWV